MATFMEEENGVISIEDPLESSSQEISPYLKARDDRVAELRPEFHLLFPTFEKEVLDMKARKTAVKRMKGQPCQIIPRMSSRIQKISHTETVLTVEEESRQKSAGSEVLVNGDIEDCTVEHLESEGGVQNGVLVTGVLECGGMDSGDLVTEGGGLVAGGLAAAVMECGVMDSGGLVIEGLSLKSLKAEVWGM